MSDFVTEFKALRRPRDGRLLFGVCASLADRFGVEVLLIRVGLVIASAFIDYLPLAYIVGVLFIPAVPKAVTAGMWVPPHDGRAEPVRRHRFRQLVLFGVLAAAADAVIDDSLPTSKTFAVLLLVAGLAMMNFRSRALRHGASTQSAAAAAHTQDGGGWAAAPAADVPPRWGLAGETVNPHVWSLSGDKGSGRGMQTLWQSQFGNFALVALVSVLAIGLWSNTAKQSPIRRAALQERLAQGSVVIVSAGELEELASTPLGDGRFIIDFTQLQLGTARAGSIALKMGSGRLDVVLPAGTVLTGRVAVSTTDGVASVVAGGKRLSPGPLSVTIPRSASDRSATGGASPTTFKVDVSVANGLVCFRSASESSCDD